MHLISFYAWTQVDTLCLSSHFHSSLSAFLSIPQTAILIIVFLLYSQSLHNTLRLSLYCVSPFPFSLSFNFITCLFLTAKFSVTYQVTSITISVTLLLFFPHSFITQPVSMLQFFPLPINIYYFPNNSLSFRSIIPLISPPLFTFFFLPSFLDIYIEFSRKFVQILWFFDLKLLITKEYVMFILYYGLKLYLLLCFFYVFQ